MATNTVTQNRQMSHFDQHQSLWLFGYGSLIYKADFPFLERRPARLYDWARRFWQGSHDHRGTPDAPGRVATLVRQPGAVCEGMAYLITPEEFDHLDFREKNGYLRFKSDIFFQNDSAVEALIYIATEDNAAFLGEASEREIAEHIAGSHGPSGANSDYLLQLAKSLRKLGEHDPHVFAIEEHLLTILEQQNA